MRVVTGQTGRCLELRVLQCGGYVAGSRTRQMRDENRASGATLLATQLQRQRTCWIAFIGDGSDETSEQGHRQRETHCDRRFNPELDAPDTWTATRAGPKLGLVIDMPMHTRRLCERTLDAYCARICPPGVRTAVNVGYQIEMSRVTLLEWRPICGVAGTRRAVSVAQMRWSPRDNLWRLYFTDDRSEWRRADRHSPARSFIDLLRAVDADDSGVFWGRIDGKSLRWCSSKGRCADCEEKYCQALGLGSEAGAHLAQRLIPRG